MGILLRIEAETAADLREKLLVLLGVAEHPLAFQHVEDPPGDEDKREVTFATLPVTEKKLRGRPRKAEPNTEAPVPTVPQHKAAEETTPGGVVTQPGEFRTATPRLGTVTVPAVPTSTPVQPATMFDAPVAALAGQPATATPATDVTFEQVKEALQKVAAVRPTDTNEMAGLNRATAIIGKVQVGCKKIKEIKPEHYAAVIAECAKA